MKRKVVLHGPSTLIVSLPSKWAKKYGIERGDEVEVKENSGSLVINTENNIKIDAKEIDVSNLSPLIRRTMMKIYQEGYDDIKIKFNRPTLIKEVQGIINELIGYEIIEQGKNFCRIKDISDVSYEDFDNVFRRVFLLIKSIFEDGQKAFQEKDKDMFKNLIYRDVDVNKLTNFCLRVLNKKSVDNKTSVYFTIIHLCERISDEYKYLIKIHLDKKIKADKNFLVMHEEIMNFFNQVYLFTFNCTKERALEIAKKYESLKEKFCKESSVNSALFGTMLKDIVFIQELQLSMLQDI